jgi:hypothetical protein
LLALLVLSIHHATRFRKCALGVFSFEQRLT